MKYFFSIIFSFSHLFFFGQSIKDQIKLINTIEQANNFLASHANPENGVWTVNPEIENDPYSRLFDNRRKGDVFSDENSIYKIIDSKKTTAFRVSYIFLDGNKLSLTSINEIRNTILKKYKSGIPFADLANQYTMDHSKDGDLDWFAEGMMIKQFETSVKNHKLNDIFTIDLEKEKWYYVTLKTFDDKEVEELTILKIRSNPQNEK